jgi:arginine deiminase
VVYYDLCERVSRILQRHGVEVLHTPGAELVKGRGGPLCMTRPVYKADNRP